MSRSNKKTLHFQCSAVEAHEVETRAESLGITKSDLLRQRVFDHGREENPENFVRIPLAEWKEMLARVKELVYEIRRHRQAARTSSRPSTETETRQ